MKYIKNLSRHVAVFCILAIASNISLAASSLYQFSGHIETIEYDDAALVSGAGWGIGTDIHYDILVDFSRAGEVTLGDGSIQVLQDLELCPGCNVSSHYFFSDLVDGNILRDPTISPSMVPEAYLKQIYGAFVVSPNLSQGSLSVWGQKSVLSIFDGSQVENWSVGKTVQVFASANNMALQASVFRGSLQLVSITPVPEPSSSFLLLIGGICIVSVARRKNRACIE